MSGSAGTSLVPLVVDWLAFEVQRQEPSEQILVGHVVRPAVGVKNRPVYRVMGLGQPRGLGIVQVRQRAFRQLGLGGSWWIEPALPKLMKPARCVSIAVLCSGAGVGKGKVSKVVVGV